MMDTLFQDLRFALRGLLKSPGFTLGVVLTLGLGIGANVTMFSVVDRMLFRPPPRLHDPSSTHRVYFAATYGGTELTSSGVQYARYVDLTNWTTSFSRTAAFSEQDLAIGVGADAREMRVAVVSASFFGFFDAPPALGRYFTAAEDAPPTGTAVAVLGYAFWQTRYGGRRDVLGTTLQIGPTVYTVIGVAPEGFVGLWPTQRPVALIPLASYANAHRPPRDTWWTTYHWTWASMLVLRKPGVSVAAADADLTNAYRRSYDAQRTTSRGLPPAQMTRPHALAASVLSERGPKESDFAKVATWVSGVALIVLLIACANVANLLLARALRRRREIAVRLALGVSRARLLSQLLTESLLLALVGGAAGVLIAEWGGAVLRAAFLSKTSETSVLLDARALLFAGAATLTAGLLTGLAPALQTRRSDLAGDLKAGAREGTYRRSRTRVALVVLQGALSVALLVGAGLFVRSLRHVTGVRLGYDVDPVLLLDLNMRGVDLDSTRAIHLRDRLLATAQTLPRVEHAARQLTVPFWSTWDMDLHVAGIDSVSRFGEFDLQAVTPDYFATVGTRILRGRGIGIEDAKDAPRAMVVSQAMAKTLWPGRDPIGQCVKVGGDTVPCTYVVGIAENIKSQNLSDDPGLFYYLASAQWHPEQGGLFIRTRGDAGVHAETIRRRLQREMPGASYLTVTPLRDILGSQTRSWQLGATMFTAFGVLALALAAIGLYSVIAYTVAQRTHDLGVRAALGAQFGDLMRLVVSEGVALGVIGVAIGLVIALVGGRWLQPLLFDESSHDPLVFGLVTAVLLGVAASASFIPAGRAARVDPMVARRYE
jgi:putative ABC transport system permease protein